MKRSKFSLSAYKLLTCDMGELVPINCMEVLPGDTIQQATSLLVRVSPLLAPVMHPVHVRIHHWYVPNRLLWDDWENFITGGPDGLDASVFPTVSTGGSGFAVGSLGDYLGVPAGVANRDVSALPFRAYAKIWNDNYRDQDLQTELALSTASGPDVTTSLALQNGAWEKDFFTTCRPWEQKGTAVSLPLGTVAPVNTSASDLITSIPPAPLRVFNMGTGLPPGSSQVLATATTTGFVGTNTAPAPSGTQTGAYPVNLYADLTTATAATINDLREAFALQRYKENRARYGSRFTEYLAAAFGVRSSDARLQRPEYLGGGRQVIQFSEVLQTAPTTSGSTPGVGNLSGHGIGAMRSNRYRKFFEEHGIIVSLLQVQPKTMYMNGLPRWWSRTIKEDFFQRELQHVGQMAVRNKEVYLAHATPDGTFGYQDRYDEYRRATSSISGEFRTTLDYWHMARNFGSAPALNGAFVASDPTKRNLQAPSADALWIMANHSVQARRVVSSNATPSVI